MTIGKSFGKFKQWTNEKLGYARGTEVSEQFKEYENHVDTRRDALDLVMSITNKYTASLEPKKIAHLSSPEFPLQALGNSLQDFSTLLSSDSQFATLLSSVASLQNNLASHQSDYLNLLRDGFAAEWGHYVSEGEKYVELRKKLESRRLDYDAKLNKVQKSKKEKPELEEEVRASLFKYEETLNEVQNKMSYLLDFEESGMKAVQLLVSAQIAYFEKCAAALQEVKSNLGPANLLSENPQRQSMIPTPSYSMPVSTVSSSLSLSRQNPPIQAKISESYSSNTSISIHAQSIDSSTVLPPLRAVSSSSSLPQSSSLNRHASSSQNLSVSSLDDRNTRTFVQPVTSVPPLTNNVRILHALYDFVAEADNELSLKVGDKITFIQEVDAGWWIGESNGKRGIFPSNYVEEASTKPVSASVHQPIITATSALPLSQQFGSTNSLHSAYSSPHPSSPSLRGGVPAMLTPTTSNTFAQPLSTTAASSISACSTCGCDEFKENLFRKNQCNNCFHNH